MSKYFMPEGWLNMAEPFECSQPAVWMVSMRGPGKTYGALDYLTEHATPKSKFIHMRITTTELDLMESENPYEEINDNTGRNIELKRVKKLTFVYRGDDKIGIHLPLHSLKNVRGFNFMSYDYLFLDEFIPERYNKRNAGDGGILLRAIETINRNRELIGRPPIKIVACSNLNQPYSKIMQSFGWTDELDKIGEADPIGVIANEDQKLVMINKSEISEKKKSTWLYRVASEKTFVDMAIDNKFGYQLMPIKHYGRNAYDYQGTIGGININILKDSGRYYITKAKEIKEYGKADLRKWMHVHAEHSRGNVWATGNYAAALFEDIFNG